MDNRKQIGNNDPLAAPLLREAQLTRPEFSATLHARLRAAVRSAAAAGPPTVIARRRRLHGDLSSWAIAAAASIALTVCSALFLHAPQRQPGPTIVQNAPIEPVKPAANDEIDSAAALVEGLATGVGQWMESTVDDNQWAGLDRDAKTALATVAGPLPFDLAAGTVTDSTR